MSSTDVSVCPRLRLNSLPVPVKSSRIQWIGTIFFATKIVAKDYMYEIGTWGYGTADEVVDFYEHQLMYEFSKEQNRHIFGFRPWACVHFLDGSKQKIYFDDPDHVIEFSEHIKAQLGLDKRLITERNTYICIGEMESSKQAEPFNNR